MTLKVVGFKKNKVVEFTGICTGDVQRNLVISGFSEDSPT